MTDTPASNPIAFVLSGQIQAPGPGTGTPASTSLVGLRGQRKLAVQLGARRSAGNTLIAQAEPGKDVVLLQIANGPTLVLHPESASDLLRAQANVPKGGPGTAATDPTEVLPMLRWGGLAEPASPTRGATRGAVGDVLLSAFEIVTLDTAADLTAAAVVQAFDGQVRAGVYALRADKLLPLNGAAPPLAAVPAAPAGAPLLVLIHGTFSNTAATFAPLWQQHPQRVGALFQHYAGRVYALEHPTLGVSPVDNALALSRALPDGARLHLLTHSRGGLVAEALARVCAEPVLDEASLALFPEESQRQALRELGAIVRAKHLQVERVMRVACPARGTLLASGRLDAYVSVFKWTLELAGVPVLPGLVDFLGAVALKRLDVAIAPGLEAQRPDGALVQWLHAAAEPLPGQLRVVAGDMSGDSIVAWLKVLVADAYYRTDNDLIVQTSSMYGGAPRKGGASFLLDTGGAVSHFAYFTRERTADAITTGLTQDAPQGFQPIGPLSWAGLSSSGVRGAVDVQDSRPASDKPAVFVLPGILGSNLAVDGERIWLGWKLISQLRRLEYVAGQADAVRPDGPVGLTYDDLIGFLGASHEVIPFAFDWRRPIEEEARRLGTAVDAALAARAQSGRPVRLLAHSMGGLLARAMQLECPQTWQRLMAHPDARLLMLGTPNGGSWAPMQVLSGDDTFGNTLIAFGAPFADAQARKMMAQFPGFIQLQAGLLDKSSGKDLSQSTTWAAMAKQDLALVEQYNWWHRDETDRWKNPYTWGVPGQAVLDAAVALRQRFDAQRDKDLPRFKDKLLLVVGRADFTPDGFTVADDGLGYLAAPEGDGRVTLASAMLPGVRTWALGCEHGSLPARKDAFPAFLELLESGSTTLLPAQAQPGATRGASAAAVPAGPAAADRSDAPLRRRPSRERRGAMPPASVDDVARLVPPAAAEVEPAALALRITVVNTDLKFVRQPLLLGHYSAMAISGTEFIVDRLIGGTMKESLAIGRYPDRPGSLQLFANTGANPDNPLQFPRPKSVIVVGLGPEGKLTGTELVYTVRQGVIAWAQQMVELPAGAPLVFEVAATLIGSGGSGISAGQAAQMVAQGVREANKRLRDDRNGRRRWPCVSRLLLVELYLDRATEAWRALQVQATTAPDDYQVDETIETGPGALRRPPDSGYRGASYDLISAIADADEHGCSRISYTLDTKRARAEVRAQAMQGPLLRELVKQAANDVNQDKQIGRTLFQLLVPLEMGAFLGGATETLLELNAGTAGIPWELLDTDGGNRGGGDDRPWAIRSKLLRKLRTDDFRRQVTDASTEASVLVVGEPWITDPAYPRLPGARKEARAVAACLGAPTALREDRIRLLASPDNEKISGPGARAVINALLERDWRIVHIAGHGEPPEKIGPVPKKADDPPQRDGDPRGVVLSSGIFLGPREIAKMPVVPELVFINCCHLGARNPGELLQTEQANLSDRAQFAAGVAGELIKIGVRCVVAAGWAVDDDPAMVFATTLYATLLRGQRFVDAVAVAREAAWRQAPDSNTWAAYQCYGDPDWSLRREGADAQRPTASMADEFAGVATPQALVLALETLTVTSRFQGTPANERPDRIRHLEARFGARWGGMGNVAEAFGGAWDAAGDRKNAIAWLERAVAAADGSATLKAGEQLGNLRARQAWSMVKKARDDGDAGAIQDAEAEADDLLLAAIATLEKLVALNPTMERLSLLGSAYKRRAMILKPGAEADEALTSMREHYRRAEEEGRRAGLAEIFYPALNRIAADLAVRARQRGAGSIDTSSWADVRQHLAAKVQDDPDFWSVVGTIELQVYDALADHHLADARPRILDAYADLHRRVPGASYWESVADQLRFVLGPGDAAGDAAPSAERAAGEEVLRLIEGYAARRT